ncbi:hypothetical protein [Tsukamurella strandjordii]|uniref:Uncharacterized protein n=1 Tax=Tsukamurella strandjordii TaxID=147577 RepID=A0AA90NAI1_9ACTN|nr:hypothetical protein [Tsukamurella strandjordii]MDP0398701.1 hypothetical protein [Tsukamurella strandjordii]
MTEVRIPADVDTALGELQGLGELLNSSEWKRAAIVWAFTDQSKGGRGKGGDKSPPFSISRFSAFRIIGLTDRSWIRKYRKAWQLAIEHGLAVDVKPGDTITLPDAEWSDYFNPKPRVPDVLPGYCTRCGAGTEPGTGEGICHSCEKETVSPFAVPVFASHRLSYTP